MKLISEEKLRLFLVIGRVLSLFDENRYKLIYTYTFVVFQSSMPQTRSPTFIQMLVVVIPEHTQPQNSD